MLVFTLILSFFVAFVTAQGAAGVIQGAGTTSTVTRTPSPTSVWATGVVNGVTTVTLSPFTQTFVSMFSTVQTPKAGSVGLGTITGTVGTVRSNYRTTITESSTSK